MLAFCICITLAIVILYIVFLYSPPQDNETNQTLEIKWEKTFGGENADRGSFILPTEDGGFLILGYTSSYGSGSEDIWLINVDETGEEIWNNTYGDLNNDFGKAVVEADGDYFIVGTKESFGSANDEAWLIKIEQSGDQIWNKTYGGTGWDEFNSIVKTSDDSYVIGGVTTSFGSGGYDAWLIKINESGDEIWNTTIGGSGIDTCRSVLEIEDEGYILVGDTDSYSSGNRNIWMIKVNETGEEIWNNTFISENKELCNEVISGVDNGFIIVGHAEIEEDRWNGIIVKTDGEGNKLWESIIDMDNETTGISSVDKCDDGYIVVGYTGMGDEQDCLIAKIGLSGDIVWKDSIDREYANGAVWIKEGENNMFYITGYWDAQTPGIYDLWLLKISI